MNPLTNVKNIRELSQNELNRGIPVEKSWHQQYKDSAWIFFGGMNFELTEGDIICVFSQYGEVVNVNLIRDQKTGKSKGFGFLCYEDQRSTILSVDNLNGIKLSGRTIRVDHVEEYKVPKIKENFDTERQKLLLEGCAPVPVPIQQKQDIPKVKREIEDVIVIKEEKSKSKKKKDKARKRKSSSSSGSSEDERKKRKKKKKHKK